MAVYKPPYICPLCNKEITFNDFIQYFNHDCKIEIRENKINDIIDESETNDKK